MGKHPTSNIEWGMGDGGWGMGNDASSRVGGGSGVKPPHSKIGYHPKVVVENPTYAFVTGGGLWL